MYNFHKRKRKSVFCDIWNLWFNMIFYFTFEYLIRFINDNELIRLSKFDFNRYQESVIIHSLRNEGKKKVKKSHKGDLSWFKHK